MLNTGVLKSTTSFKSIDDGPYIEKETVDRRSIDGRSAIAIRRTLPQRGTFQHARLTPLRV